MTPDILAVLGILLVAVILLVTEKIPLEVTALLVLGGVALTGLVRPVEARQRAAWQRAHKLWRAVRSHWLNTNGHAWRSCKVGKDRFRDTTRHVLQLAHA